jgi:hypothetical protein
MDPVANGDSFEWAVGRLRARLPDMLRESGGETLASAIEPGTLLAALDQVVSLRAGTAVSIAGRAAS